jgi:hypothetical protein
MGSANTMGNALASMGSMYQQQQQQNQNQANFNRMFPSGGNVTVNPSFETGMNMNFPGYS